MKKKHQHPPIHVYPPFPSFAWVMTAQANPPTPAYAHGYIQSARAHNGIHPNPHPRLPAHRVSPRARHWPHPRSTKSRSPPPSRAKSKGAAAAAAVAQNGKFMETVDYRYRDPPSRPYVPWHEGYALLGRGAQHQRQKQHQHQHQLLQQHAIPPSFPIVVAPPAVVATAVSKCGFARGSEGDNDDDVDHRRKKTTTTVDVVKIKRLDIMLNALCRACKFKDRRKETGRAIDAYVIA